MKSWLCWGAFVLALGGCTDSGGGDTDSDTDGTSSEGTSTSPTGPSTTATTGPSTTATTSSSSTTVDPDTGSSSDSSSSGDPDGSSSSSGGSANVCAGYTALGAAAQVHSSGPQPPIMCSPKPAPCGGSPVGTWSIEGACGYEVLPDFAEELCEGATQQITGASVSGTRTLAEDGTFSSDVVIQLEIDFQVDSMDCAGLECVEFGETLSMVDSLTMTCVDAEVGCDCQYTLDLPESQEGTWDTLEDSLLITVDDNLEAIYEYCVEDSQLTIWMPLFSEEVFERTSCEDDIDCEGQVDGPFDFVGCTEPDEDER